MPTKAAWPNEVRPADAGEQHQAERDQRVEADVVGLRDPEVGHRRERHQHEAEREDGAARGGRRVAAAPSLLLVGVAVLERAPQQHRDDDGEDDHLLEGAGPERAEALEHADERARRARRRG